MSALATVDLYPGIIPADILTWAKETALAHEQEWGFEEDVGVAGPLCAWRGSVPEHTDFDFSRDEIVIGLVLHTEGQDVFAKGASPARLKRGTVFLLDPAIPHGTKALDRDDLLVFLTGTTNRRGPTDPYWIASILLKSARHEMARNQRAARQERDMELAAMRGVD